MTDVVNKKWWTSKTLWTNTVILVATIIMGKENPLDPVTLTGILVVVNIILRAVTKSNIIW